MGEKEGTARIEDVAALAGTSTMTVSRALREPSKVAPATRARILEAVQRLGYIPNLSASSLASRRSRIIAVLVPTIGNSIFAETVQGLSDAVSEAGFQLLLGDYAYSEAREAELLRALIGRQPDGLMVVGVLRDPKLRALLRKGKLAVVETWDLTDDPVGAVVGFSNAAAGAAMARYFLDRGRRRLAFVGGGDERARARRSGYVAAARAAGAAEPILVAIPSGLSIAAGRKAMARMLDDGPPPDAVFFATDVLGMGGLLECQHRGVAMPGKVAIAGLGDLELARELTPSLTTVRIPSHAIGRRAGELLLAQLAGERVTERVVDLGFEVIARESA